jgi:hypothetical protein
MTLQAHFFNSLCDVASPAAPGQFTAFLQLVAEFAPLMISYEEREELRRSIAKEHSKHKRKRLTESQDESMDLEGGSSQAEHALGDDSGSKKARTGVNEASESGEDVKLRESDDISFIARIFLRLAEMLVSAVTHLSSASER